MSTIAVMQIIIAMAAVTFLLRSVPFLLPRRILDSPVVQLASGYIPLVIMTILVVHSFDGAEFSVDGSAVPIAVGIGVVSLLHVVFGNPLISIFGGVAAHIALLAMM